MGVFIGPGTFLQQLIPTINITSSLFKSSTAYKSSLNISCQRQSDFKEKVFPFLTSDVL